MQGAERPPRKRAWLLPLLCLSLALGWSVVLRIPLIANAPVHLDSDLAVDGLTLREAVHGQWRWHYPGTPYMGTGAVLLSLPGVLLQGVRPETLVAGGTFAYLLLIAGVFALARMAFSVKTAVWSLLPLAFASTGTIWLTGRITGGHMLAAAWSAAAWLLFVWFVSGGGKGRGAILGVWGGLGLWHDSMFLMTLLGLITAGAVALVLTRGIWPLRQAGMVGLITALGFAIGASPRVIGRALEPHDAYGDQFTATFDPPILQEHARILFLDCLPRLFAGHRLPGLEADPDPALLGGGAPVQRAGGRAGSVGVTAVATTCLGLGLFAVSFATLVVQGVTAGPAVRATALGLLVSSTAILAGFVVNRNIFNSDNYRYLVLLLIPAALGFGRAMEALARRSTGGAAAAAGIAVALGLTFTLDASAWYRRLGWIDDRGGLMKQAVDDPALQWLNAHPEVDVFTSGYWDAYRLAFLADRPLRGVPTPIYPNRFPEWSSELPGGRPRVLIARPNPEDQRFLQEALAEGGRLLLRERGTMIVERSLHP